MTTKYLSTLVHLNEFIYIIRQIDMHCNRAEIIGVFAVYFFKISQKELKLLKRKLSEMKVLRLTKKGIYSKHCNNDILRDINSACNIKGERLCVSSGNTEPQLPEELSSLKFFLFIIRN